MMVVNDNLLEGRGGEFWTIFLVILRAFYQTLKRVYRVLIHTLTYLHCTYPFMQNAKELQNLVNRRRQMKISSR